MCLASSIINNVSFFNYIINDIAVAFQTLLLKRGLYELIEPPETPAIQLLCFPNGTCIL